MFSFVSSDYHASAYNMFLFFGMLSDEDYGNNLIFFKTRKLLVYILYIRERNANWLERYLHPLAFNCC